MRKTATNLSMAVDDAGQHNAKLPDRNNPKPPDERQPEERRDGDGDERDASNSSEEAGDEEEPRATKLKPPKRGYQVLRSAPLCPTCSKEGQPVLCKAGSSRSLITYYYCPNKCGHSVSVPRPDIGEQLRRQQARGGFSAR